MIDKTCTYVCGYRPTTASTVWPHRPI